MASTTYERFLPYTVKSCNNFLTAIKINHLGNVPVMVRNAGQLPQPFWLNAAHGSGSRSAARCAART